MASRVSSDTLHGDGGNEGLEKRIRKQGNFGEYVPLALILVALLDAGRGGPTLVRTMLIVLLVGRVLHLFGMFAAKNSPCSSPAAAAASSPPSASSQPLPSP